MEEGPGFALAHHLGRALQLTNILRDLDEDAAIGRLYLPREYLRDAGITTLDPKAAIADPRDRPGAAAPSPRWRTSITTKAASGAGRSVPRAASRTPRLMGAVYGEILRQTEAAGWAPPRHARQPRQGATAVGIVLRHGLFG